MNFWNSNGLLGVTENLQFKFLYQGKEYVDFLGLNTFDFHARGLDTWTGRFSGVDPVDNFSLSGYASMMNNPISYIDPDGRNPIAIGFMIGLFSGAIKNMIKGTQPKNIGQFIAPGLVGAVGGGLGALAPIGILPGMAFGAGSGAITGGLGAAFSGGNIGRGIGYGAIGGGIFGGINGYLSTTDGVNPWTGTGSTSHAFTMSSNPSGSSWATTDEMRASYDGTIGLKDNMSLSEIEDKLNTNVSLASDLNLPSKDYFMEDGTIGFTNSNGGAGYAGGVTSTNYKFGFIKNSYIRMSPSLKGTTIEFQNFVFKHEFMHAWHWKINSSLYGEFSERATSTYTLAYQKAYNITSQLHTTRLALAGAGGSHYPSLYSWRNFNKIVPLWLK